MAHSGVIKERVNQAAVQAATVVMMAFRNTEIGPWPTTILNQWQTQRQRHGGPILEKPKFNFDTQDRYIKLLNFKVEVTNILETRAYYISDEERLQLLRTC